jgi:hypothetical protein
VEIELLLDRLTVSVRDHDPRLPVVRDADLSETCGRGLAMVASVSESWGVRPDGESGKVVWFTLPAPSPTAALPPCPSYGAAAESPARSFAEVEHAAGALGAGHAPARSAVAG